MVYLNKNGQNALYNYNILLKFGVFTKMNVHDEI